MAGRFDPGQSGGGRAATPEFPPGLRHAPGAAGAGAKTPAGQLYALYGLAKVAPERYCALRGRVKADSPVHSWKGDTGMGLTAGFITSYWESNGVKCPGGRRERDR